MKYAGSPLTALVSDMQRIAREQGMTTIARCMGCGEFVDVDEVREDVHADECGPVVVVDLVSREPKDPASRETCDCDDPCRRCREVRTHVHVMATIEPAVDGVGDAVTKRVAYCLACADALNL